MAEAVSSLARARPDAVTTFPGTGQKIALAELEAASARFGHGLIGAGVEPGDVVGLLLPIGSELLVTLLGTVRAGAVATVLPVAPSDARSSARRVLPLVREADLRAVVTDDAFGAVAAELARARTGLAVVSASENRPGAGALPRVSGADLAVLQFTSGSTMAPRGVELTHSNIVAGLSAIAVSAEMTETDVWVQWTPPYHDLGLFGMLTSVLNGGTTHAMAPHDFVRRPERFLSLIAETGGTLTTGPNFSYDLLIRAAAAGKARGLDLSRWRLAFNGGEPISAQTVETFARVFADAGVRPSVMYPVYGMAESTLAIAFPTPETVPKTAWVDRADLGTKNVARKVDSSNPAAVGIVCVGRPVAGMQLRIVADDTLCEERRLGEIQLRGPAVTSGYYRNDHATSMLRTDGWLRTGDLGFWLDGELYVGGRLKEMVIVNGCNYFPADVEQLARRVPGVYHGHLVAFADTAADGGECIGLIAETDLPEHRHCELAKTIRERVAATIGTTRIEVHPAPPHFLTRSTSGKWQRLSAAERIGASRRPHSRGATS
ncbi:acyl-CoA synthetase (AMP-forming)/AMP-acid ligase II [Nocardia tenerifensis]|uniref:Acyl-CoA synthetase (AMP-forming)/AMP-acid ligase II n=1 Tax=Nocardia tenerifensis TaxID=228006 RepID=A0A318K559_9NOCA|nr:acyl-CoA synthetase (AMP-forming)/AMP-acid ligase II [Nocardia tenerifensis]